MKFKQNMIVGGGNSWMKVLTSIEVFRNHIERVVLKATRDLDGDRWTTFLDPLATPWWLARSAKILSNDHNTKDPSASKDRWPSQSTDALKTSWEMCARGVCSEKQ
jgi:hypothetical protein